MARKRIPRERVTLASSPAQQDEADIVEEAGAETDENGDLVTDEDSILRVGAVDSDSVRENRQIDQAVNKKRGGEKNVPFNTSDLLTKYEGLLKLWNANTLDISVKRLTGTPVQQVIISRPRSGVELYEAIRIIHGSHGEADYEIKFFDANGKMVRGNGRITMPDARGQGQPQPMNPYPPPPGFPYAAPPGYAPAGYYPAQQPQQPQPTQQQPQPVQQPHAAQQPPPVVHVQTPAGPDMGTMMSSMQQMFEMFHAMREKLSPPPPLQAPSYQPPPPTQPFVMPPPPSTPDMGAMMAWMQQMFEMFQKMQQAQQVQMPAMPPPPPAPPRNDGGGQPPPNPMMAMMGMVPPMQPPPGTMWVPGFGFVPVEGLLAAIGAGRPGVAPGGYRRPQYNPDGPPPYMREPPPPPPQPQQRPQTPAELFRDAAMTMRTTVDAINEINSILPGYVGDSRGQDEPAPLRRDQEDEDSPVRLIDTGAARIVVNKSDGSLRGVETLWANADKVLKWVGEQREQIQRANAEHQREQRAPAQLPPGYVEVGPGYKPPPGFVAVPIDQSHSSPPPPQDLPPPPQRMPPPIWTAPSVPERES